VRAGVRTYVCSKKLTDHLAMLGGQSPFPKTFKHCITLSQCVPEICCRLMRKPQRNVNVWHMELLQGYSFMFLNANKLNEKYAHFVIHPVTKL